VPWAAHVTIRPQKLLAWLTKNWSITLVPAASLEPPSHPPERSFGHRPLDRLWLTKRPDCGTGSGHA
jgi:hypothetical protein